MTLVVDASVIVAALLDELAEGTWARTLLASNELIAPHLMPAEAANILRRAALSGEFADQNVSSAQTELFRLPVELFPFEPFAKRIWELRQNITA